MGMEGIYPRRPWLVSERRVGGIGRVSLLMGLERGRGGLIGHARRPNWDQGAAIVVSV